MKSPANFMATTSLPLQFNNTIFISARLFSSSAARSYRKDAPDNTDTESAVYKRALQLQRPTTVRYQENLRNSVSLIGAIDMPLKACHSAVFGVQTFLKVREPASPYRDFTMMLTFWGEMAEVSVQHLKLHDLVYVSGRLGSYLKADKDGSSVRYESLRSHCPLPRRPSPVAASLRASASSPLPPASSSPVAASLRQTGATAPCLVACRSVAPAPLPRRVDVKEMNFVAENSPGLASQNLVKLEPKVSFEDMMQRRRNRLHLWHVFFANPAEWWDNRKCKLKPGLPDFKHKDTGEALWLSHSDPPWINQQLQLHDSRLSKRSHVDQRNAWSHLSPLVYDEV